MSDTQNRDAVLERFYEPHCGKGVRAAVLILVSNDMAARIVELEAAVERVRALHQPIAKDIPKCVICKNYDGRHVDHPCPTLRALDGDA